MHFSDILSLAARAWHETKPAGDPEFNDCALTHRENLGAAAKAVVDSGEAFSAFDRAVLRLYLADKEAQSGAERILEANPLLHSDEVMHIASGTPHPLVPAQFAGHAENAQKAAVREEFKPDTAALEATDINAVSKGNSNVSMSEASPAPEKPKRKPSKKKSKK